MRVFLIKCAGAAHRLLIILLMMNDESLNAVQTDDIHSEALPAGAPATSAVIFSVSGTCTELVMDTEASSGARALRRSYGATRLLASIWNT